MINANLIALYKKANKAENNLMAPWTISGKTPSDSVLKAAHTRANNKLVRAVREQVGNDMNATITLMREIAAAA